jgi:predicted oxidoreductase
MVFQLCPKQGRVQKIYSNKRKLQAELLKSEVNEKLIVEYVALQKKIHALKIMETNKAAIRLRYTTTIYYGYDIRPVSTRQP